MSMGIRIIIFEMIFFCIIVQDGGHIFKINDEMRSFRGTVAFVSGDNLGSQEIGGFKIEPGANRKCRECMGNPEDVATKVQYNILIKLHWQ
jgi:hypothetical protein